MQRVPAHCTMKILRPFRGIDGSGGLPVSPPYGSRWLHVSRHTGLHPRLLAVDGNWVEAILPVFSAHYLLLFPRCSTPPPRPLMGPLFLVSATPPFGHLVT